MFNFTEQHFFSLTFSALKHRNYRLWFCGQLVSIFGTWMQMTALSYLIFELTHSATYLGLFSFITGLPTWFFMLYGGVIADRFPKRSVLLVAQYVLMILAFVLTAFTFTGIIKPWHIIALGFILGTVTAFEAPARLSFIIELIDKKDLMNAIALNSMMFNSAAFVGPALSGITYAAYGPGWCFLVNGISYLAIIISLSLMRFERARQQERKITSIGELKEGATFVLKNKIIRTIIANMAVTTLITFSVITLIPAWAVKVLDGGAKVTGFMQSARGAGALVAAFFMAWLGSKIIQKGKLFILGNILCAVVFLVFSFTHILSFSLVLLFVMGVASILIFNLANNLLQTSTPDELRGRVMSIYSLMFFGLTPIGGFFAGVFTDMVGAPLTVRYYMITALALILFLLWKFPELYREK